MLLKGAEQGRAEQKNLVMMVLKRWGEQGLSKAEQKIVTTFLHWRECYISAVEASL